MKTRLGWPAHLAQRHMVRGVVAAAVLFAGAMSAWALTDLTTVKAVDGTVIGSIGGHISQGSLTQQVQAGDAAGAFDRAFEHGDNLFASKFNAADGGGANVGGEQRYTRTPRADQTASPLWKTHTPARATGPNAAACNECHLLGGDDGAGPAAANVHRDPLRNGQLGQFIQRNTPALFGLGGLQRLAEEMTTDLQAVRTAARAACNCGTVTTSCTNTRALTSKGVNFGTLTITRNSGSSTCNQSIAVPISGGAQAVASDLVVRPFQWKGSVAFIRDFVRGAGHNELGMQGSELLGSPTVDPATVDGDGDGVVNELFVGDITSLTVYQAAQPRPTTRQELASLGLAPALTSAETSAIAAGSTLFDQVGCNVCHIRQLLVNNVKFQEPSALAAFRDPSNLFPNGRSYAAGSFDPANPVSFDITRDQPENSQFALPNGQKLSNFTRDSSGRAVIALFADLRRHNMGSGLAESIDEVGTGSSVFLTRTLWGVGSTAPYMHDGRAVTLTEAILEHGGEAQNSRNSYTALSTTQKQQLNAFLNNLVLFKAEEE
ncbi:MAG TPA: di-heme oxidoredictase family protein [Polyangia bacterium]|nr:di-heme oxidoredictase family protein [Polyangia bacterium]